MIWVENSIPFFITMQDQVKIPSYADISVVFIVNVSFHCVPTRFFIPVMIRPINIIYNDLNVLFSALKIYFDLVLGFDRSYFLPKFLFPYGGYSSQGTPGFHVGAHIFLHSAYDVFHVMVSLCRFLKENDTFSVFSITTIENIFFSFSSNCCGVNLVEG